MCQLSDRSGVEAVAKAFFAGDYDTGRELEPDGAAAGVNLGIPRNRSVSTSGNFSARLVRDRSAILGWSCCGDYRSLERW